MTLNNILSTIGGHGPLILFFLSLFMLKNKPNGLYYYLIGWVLNFILNITLKGLIQQPRPIDNQDIFKIALNHYKKHNTIIPFDVFGMPSGHAQSVMYSTIFVHLMLKNSKLTLLYLIISIITISQRINELHHTIFQVLVGSLVGLVFGYFIFYLYRQKMMGNLSLKKDDFAFV